MHFLLPVSSHIYEDAHTAKPVKPPPKLELCVSLVYLCGASVAALCNKVEAHQSFEISCLLKTAVDKHMFEACVTVYPHPIGAYLGKKKNSHFFI